MKTEPYGRRCWRHSKPRMRSRPSTATWLWPPAYRSATRRAIHPGTRSIRIAGDDGTKALIAADTFNHPAQFAHPDWPSGPDNDHATAAATRRLVLAELAAEPATTIAPTHFGEAFGHMVTGADHSAAWEPLSQTP